MVSGPNQDNLMTTPRCRTVPRQSCRSGVHSAQPAQHQAMSRPGRTAALSFSDHAVRPTADNAGSSPPASRESLDGAILNRIAWLSGLWPGAPVLKKPVNWLRDRLDRGRARTRADGVQG